MDAIMDAKKITTVLLIACLVWESAAFAAPSLGKTLERAQTDYSRLEFDTAKKSLQKKLDDLNRNGMTHEDTLSLVSATILLGELHYVSGDFDRAKKAFEEVVRLAPETTLSEKKHAPQVRRLFDETKQGVLANNKKLGQLKVTSNPGKAEVYLNGVLKGKTPVQIKGVLPGPQTVSLTEEGRVTLVQRVDLQAGETLKIAGDLLENSQENSQETPQGVPEKVATEAATGFEKRSEKESAPASETGKRSFWKRPVVWIVAGALVAGGGASAGILLTRGGGSGPGEIGVVVGGSGPALQ